MSRNTYITNFLLRNCTKLRPFCPKDLGRRLKYQARIAKHAWQHYIKNLNRR